MSVFHYNSRDLKHRQRIRRWRRVKLLYDWVVDVVHGVKTKRVYENRAESLHKHRPRTIKNFVMSSFEELHLFLLSHENSTINNSEFSVLHEEFMTKTRDFSCKERDRFSLKEMNDAEYLARYNLKRPSYIKVYPKNTSESPHVDRNQKKMK